MRFRAMNFKHLLFSLLGGQRKQSVNDQACGLGLCAGWLLILFASQCAEGLARPRFHDQYRGT